MVMMMMMFGNQEDGSRGAATGLDIATIYDNIKVINIWNSRFEDGMIYLLPRPKQARLCMNILILFFHVVCNDCLSNLD